MKRYVMLLLVLLLSGCGGESNEAQKELFLFAASSLTEPLTELGNRYEETHPQVDLVYNFDSSGTLQTQIEAGAACDLFLSAAQKQMDELEAQGLLREETRVDLLENQVVLLVPAGNPAGLDAFEDVLSHKVELVAVGNADVPAGQYAEEILTSMGLWETLQAEEKLTYGTNVKEVVAQVEAGAVDCGIVYATDASSAGLPAAAVAPEGTHQPVVYPAAVLKHAEHRQEAADFLDFLSGREGQEIFRSYGFAIPGEEEN